MANPYDQYKVEAPVASTNPYVKYQQPSEDRSQGLQTILRPFMRGFGEELVPFFPQAGKAIVPGNYEQKPGEEGLPSKVAEFAGRGVGMVPSFFVGGLAAKGITAIPKVARGIEALQAGGKLAQAGARAITPAIESGVVGLTRGAESPEERLKRTLEYAGAGALTGAILPPIVGKVKSLLGKEAPVVPPEPVTSSTVTTEPQKPIVKQPLPAGEKQRKFLETAATSPTTTEPVKAGVEAITPQGYVPITNQESLANIDARIQKEGTDKIQEFVLSKSPPSAEKGAAFIRLTDKYQKEGNVDAAVNLVENYDKQLREAGRFVQAASIWDRLTPQGMLRMAEKEVAQANKNRLGINIFGKRIGEKELTLPKEMKAEILTKQAEINLMPDSEAKAQASKALLERIGEFIPPGVSEKFDAYRYTNMLSSPKTQLRNIDENLYNTFITRPWDLGTKGFIDWIQSGTTGKPREAWMSDVPLYYKKAINSIPDAWKAAKEVWKKEIDIAKPDIQDIRAKQLPSALTAVPRFMEAADRFNSTLISAGEYAVQKKAGATDEAAQQAAHAIAQKYLYRSTLGLDSKEKSTVTQALSGLGETLQYMRGKVPGSNWFVPFIRTPLNKAIEMVERVPVVGQAGGKIGLEEQARAVNGSIMMGLGAMAAWSGNATWAPPRDPKERELFYASGRKAFAVRAGDTWIPIWYLGPFALAFALPAAMKYYSEDAPTAITGDKAKIAGNIALAGARFLSEQTALQGVGGLFKMLEGDADVTLSNLLGFTAGQVVPAEGLVRYINTILDPIYRKPKGFVETIMRDIPGLSTQLESFKTPTGEPAQREPINVALPYDVGKAKPEYDPFLEERQKTLQMNALLNSFDKQLGQ